MTDIPPSRPPETLEETMARLQRHRPSTPPQGDGRDPAATATPPSPVAPAPSAALWASAAAPGPGSPQPVSSPDSGPTDYGPAYVPARATVERPPRKKTPWIVAGIGVVVAVVAGSLTFAAVSNPGLLDGVDWSAYPGTSYADPAVVLADVSFEELLERSTAVEQEFRDRLTEEFGLVWTQNYEGDTEATTNGYRGDSLLHSYISGEWQGSATLTDPGARARVQEIFVEVVTAAGLEDSLFANEVYADNDEESKSQFGAPFGSEQAVWSISSGGISRSYTISVRVFDQRYRTDPSFTGDVWFRIEDDSDTNFHVTLNAWAYSLLPAEDRAEFIERLKPYEGLEQPEPR